MKDKKAINDIGKYIIKYIIKFKDLEKRWNMHESELFIIVNKNEIPSYRLIRKMKKQTGEIYYICSKREKNSFISGSKTYLKKESIQFEFDHFVFDEDDILAFEDEHQYLKDVVITDVYKESQSIKEIHSPHQKELGDENLIETECKNIEERQKKFLGISAEDIDNYLANYPEIEKGRKSELLAVRGFIAGLPMGEIYQSVKNFPPSDIDNGKSIVRRWIREGYKNLPGPLRSKLR
jgi:hypothetical protein